MWVVCVCVYTHTSCPFKVLVNEFVGINCWGKVRITPGARGGAVHGRCMKSMLLGAIWQYSEQHGQGPPAITLLLWKDVFLAPSKSFAHDATW